MPTYAASSSGGSSSGKDTSPGVVVPPLSMMTTPAVTAWPAADFVLYNRFHLPTAGDYRYVHFRMGTAPDYAGGESFQVGVVSLSDLDNYTRVVEWTSGGTNEEPTAGSVQVDLGSFSLDSGDYALFFWADNTTVTVPHIVDAELVGSRIALQESALTGGVPASGTASLGTRCLIGFTLSRYAA